MRTDAGTEEGYHVNCLARICELEAELAEFERARTEKAEKERDELQICFDEAKARVAELEARLYCSATVSHQHECKHVHEAREKEG